ncbi:kisspeptin 2 [Pangasianodon hypophthalmus]|uniref:kisspeptin 2 n=1 Tax=Pangasianodon hypophthalmus TaxID=310915 RepID=UPI002307BB70|nr:kisspeptin 2 [Pangasianodon hypophthalmus]
MLFQVKSGRKTRVKLLRQPGFVTALNPRESQRILDSEVRFSFSALKQTLMHFGLEVTDITMSPHAYILREALTWTGYSQQRRGSAQESAPSPDNMKLQVLILFTSVLVAHYASSRVSIPDFVGLREPDQRGVDERSTSEDDSICFLLKEKDSESHISCKHRLTRSKFNYNPFGLRFGKRDGRLKSDRSGMRKMLPVLLLLRELEEAS